MCVLDSLETILSNLKKANMNKKETDDVRY